MSMFVGQKSPLHILAESIPQLTNLPTCFHGRGMQIVAGMASGDGGRGEFKLKNIGIKVFFLVTVSYLYPKNGSWPVFTTS